MQNRNPPAYQEYAADLLASRPFRLMTPTERGVLYSMKLECWANKSLPADPAVMAKILLIEPEAVAAALPAVMPFFFLEDGEIRCVELDNYRAHLETIRLQKSQGGKTGASITNSKRQKPNRRKSAKDQVVVDDASIPTSISASCPTPAPTAFGRVLNTAKPNAIKSNPSIEIVLPPADPWVADYEKTHVDSAEAYRKASGR